MRILIAEDQPELLELLVKRLKQEGYGADGCPDGEEAAYYLETTSYDLAILDIMMPKKDGLTLVRELRAKGNPLPVLLLTARDAVSDRVAGLDAGADDYLVKPFSFDELLARIRVLLRRNTPHKGDQLSIGNLTMELSTHKVTRAGQPIELSSREFAMLEYLLRHQEQVVSREQIGNHVWDYSFEGGSNIVDVYIRYLRRKIDEPFEKKLLHTVRGAGYQLKEEP